MSIATTGARLRAPDPLSDLVDRVDLCSLLERYSGPGKPSGHTVLFRCPNPEHPDNHPSFTVNRSKAGKQQGRCFSQCNWHGDALDLVQWLEGLSAGEAAAWLRRWLGDAEWEPAPRAPKAAPKPSAPRVLTDSAPKPDPDRAAWLLGKYLEARGWPTEVVDRFGLEVVTDSHGAERIRHPYYSPTASGGWVLSWWQDRGTKGSRIKWLSPKDAPPVLYNLRSLETDELSAVVITEGPADCITATLALEDLPSVAVIGVPGAGAWRTEWAELLTGLRVVVAADDDEAGRRLEEAVRASVRCSVGIYRPSRGDLTDTVLEVGLVEVRALLLEALGSSFTLELHALTEPTKRPLEETLEKILRVFPGSELVAEVPA